MARRVAAGETPGYPRFHGANRYNSFTYEQCSNGVTLDTGFLVLSKIGRVAVRWSRPIVGTPKTVTISRFLSVLSFKAASAGRSVVAVPPASTSQTCSGGGVLVHQMKRLSQMLDELEAGNAYMRMPYQATAT